jgi:site-specific recombinase XerD
MVVECLPSDNIYSQLKLPLNYLLSTKPLYKEARLYLATCQVEGLSKKTLRVYGDVISNFLRFNNNPDPTDENVTMFLLQKQSTGCSAFTSHQYYRSLKTWFNWMVKKKMMKSNPMEGMKAPKLPKVVIIPLSNEDIKHILVVTSGRDFLSYRNEAMFWIFYDTGIRSEELAGLMLDDYLVKQDAIRVLGKGQKERLVRIGSRTQKALLTYLNMRTDKHPNMWVTEERKPLTGYGVQMVFHNLMRRAKVSTKKKGTHIIRHTAAITVLRNGGDLVSLQQMMGHADIQTTRRYLSSIAYDDVAKMHKKAGPADNLKL